MSIQFQATNFAGGSRSEDFEDSSRGGIFQQGVKALYPKQSKVLRVRVLPAFDRSLSVNDLAFPTSVVPYRDVGIPQDSETKSEGFTSWYLVVQEYTMIGNSKFSFLSPVTLANLGVQGDVRDPMQLMRRFAKDNPKWKHLIDVKLGYGKQTVDLLPKLKSSAVMNVLSFDERSGAPSEVNVTKISWTALSELKKTLTAPRPAGQNPIGPTDWDNRYMVGDITSPQFGLLGTIESMAVGPISANCFRFSNHPQILQGHMQFPIDVNTPFGKDVLSKRYDLFSDKTLKAISFQDIVSWIVQDGSVPYELVQESLGGFCNVPAAPNRPTVSYPSQPPAQQGWTGGQPAATQSWAPAAPAPAQSWTPAAPVAPAPTQSWAPAAPATPQSWTPAAPVVAPQPQAWTPQAPVMPPQPQAWTPAVPAPAATEDVPYTFAAPAPVAPPMLPPTLPPVLSTPPPAPEPKFWYVNNNTPTLGTKTEVVSYAKAGYSGPVMAENQQGGWKTLADFGLVDPAAPTPGQSWTPAAPVAPVYQAPAPTVTANQNPAPMQPPAPAHQAPVAQPNAGIAAPVTPALAPAQSALNPEEQAKLNQYIAAVAAGQLPSPEQLKEYGALMVRFSSQAA